MGGRRVGMCKFVSLFCAYNPACPVVTSYLSLTHSQIVDGGENLNLTACFYQLTSLTYPKV
ncbi:hypothetical protein J6590_101391 [Homalodisca vitripennis]|nr:hypothetical protein J6590_101391 [Homalodisca vitripennis]